MKRTTIILLLLMFTATTFAQTKKEKQVAAAVSQLTNAMTDADSLLLDRLVNDQLSYGHSGGHVEGKVEFISKIVSGKSDFVSIGLNNQTIAVSGSTAIVRHRLDAKTNDNGKPGEVHLQVLLVWQKLHGHWKLLARQAVKTMQ